MLLEMSEEITPERMKGWSQSKNNAHLWMGLVKEARSNVVSQYCIGTWNVRFMSQGKLEVVKQEMARMHVDIVGIRERKQTGMGEFNSDDHYIYYRGQESLRRNGVAIMVNKRVRNVVLGSNLKNDRMISIPFQGKPFGIIVIQVYNTTEDEVKWFHEDLQELLELTPKKCPFHHSRLKCKIMKSRDTWNNKKVWPWGTK